MKRFFLSLSLITAFAVYAILSQAKDIYVATPGGQTPGPNPDGAQNPDPTPAPAPTPTPAPKPTSQYKDGQYTGSVADAYYGYVQVKVIISGGKITDVLFLNYPQDRSTSIEINTQAMPYLTQEAIQAQKANVDIVSGATETSRAFRESLASALTKAK